jgi:hypothetical protein
VRAKCHYPVPLPCCRPGGEDTNAPTILLVDGTGAVRWFYRADRFMVRLSPEELLKAVDQHLSGKGS